MKPFSEIIKEFRKDKGISQEYLAQLLGISNKTVMRWERGKVSPNPRKAEFMKKRLEEFRD